MLPCFFGVRCFRKTWLAPFWRNTLGSPSLMMNLLIVFDVDIFSSHRGDASQSEIANGTMPDLLYKTGGNN